MLDLTRLHDAIRHEGGITRRLLLAYGAALAAIPVLGQRGDGQAAGRIKFPSNPFTLGVASGEPNAEGMVLWTRLAPRPLQDDGDGGMPRQDVEVHWELATDDRMRRVIQKGTVTATRRLGHSVHVIPQGLKPDTWYWYRFHCSGEESPIGRTRTMPEPSSMPARLRFAFASCQNLQDGLYTAYRHMANDDLDLVVFLGDYIYEGGPRKGAVRVHVGDRCRSLADYRQRHAQYRSDRLLQAMHARCPWLVTWDDHEVENNYANATAHATKLNRMEFLEKRAHAYQAYYEMMPLRPRARPDGPNMHLSHSAAFGRLVNFKVLDTRQHRTDQPNGGERSDINAAALNPRSTMLGAAQKKWLEDSLLKSNAVWNVLAQQVMMGMVDTDAGKERRYSMDQWPGYMHERRQILEFLARQRISNPIVITGDIHSNWVNNLRVDDRKADLPIVATEFVGTSISSKGDGHEVSKARLNALYSNNPCLKYHDDQRGYVRCTVTSKEWRSEYQAVLDVTRPGGKAERRATYVVAAGKPGAERG